MSNGSYIVQNSDTMAQVQFFYVLPFTAIKQFIRVLRRTLYLCIWNLFESIQPTLKSSAQCHVWLM